MDTSDAYNIAQNLLLRAEENGFEEAINFVGETEQKDISGTDGHIYDVEISYSWEGEENTTIRVSCCVTSKNWYAHKQINEHITLSNHGI